MSISRTRFADNTASPGTTYSALVTGWAVDETVLAWIRWLGTTTITDVTCTGEANLTVIGSPQTGGPDNARSQWAILDRVTASGDKTIAANMSGSATGGIAVWGLSGCRLTGAFGAQSGTSGTTANPATTVPVLGAKSAVFCGLINNTAEGTPIGGFSAESVTDTYWYDSAAFNIDAGLTIGDIVTGFTVSSSTWVLNAISILAAEIASGRAPYVVPLKRRTRYAV